MRRFVSARRKPTRRIVVRTEAKKTSERKLFLFYHWQKIVGGIIAVSIIYAVFFYNWNPIKNVAFSQNTYNKYEYQPIMDIISQELIDKGYFKQKYRKRNELTTTVRRQYPIVKSMRVVSFDKGTITIDIIFNAPDFVATTLDTHQRYIYHNTFIPFITGSEIGSGLVNMNITIPHDMIETHSGGVFWKIGSTDLVKIMNKIDFLPVENRQYTYYPGWEKLKVVSNNQTYLISLEVKTLEETFKKWQEIIPYMPTSDPFIADLSNPDRIVIKQ